MIVWVPVLCLTLVLCVANWYLVIARLLRPGVPSWIPLAGGILLAGLLFWAPLTALRAWWWTAVFVDGGCVPGFAIALFCLQVKASQD